jgi:hypothetical protein
MTQTDRTCDPIPYLPLSALCLLWISTSFSSPNRIVAAQYGFSFNVNDSWGDNVNDMRGDSPSRAFLLNAARNSKGDEIQQQQTTRWASEDSSKTAQAVRNFLAGANGQFPFVDDSYYWRGQYTALAFVFIAIVLSIFGFGFLLGWLSGRHGGEAP